MDSDREEILSFSDLRFSSDDGDLQLDSKLFLTDENQNSIISSSASFFDQDFSGFFTEEYWSTTAATISSNTPNHILFCGKLIHTSRNTQFPNPKNKTDLNNNNNNNKSSLSRCNSDSFNNCSNGHSSSSSLTSLSNSLRVSGRKKHDRYKNDVLAERTSKLACSSSKSRWQVFMFGSGRFPTQMELSDIRSRQLRQIPSTMSVKKGGGNGLRWLIRILGCGGGFNSDDTVHSFDR